MASFRHGTDPFPPKEPPHLPSFFLFSFPLVKHLLFGIAHSTTLSILYPLKPSLSNSSLSPPSATVVVCDHGNLYDKEEIIRLLLRRAQGSSSDDGSLAHIRGTGDLHGIKYGEVCPVTGAETMNGGSAAFLVVAEKKKKKKDKDVG